MRKMLIAMSLAAMAAPVTAKDVEFNPNLAECGASCQDEFQTMSEDLIAAIDYKAAGPAEATGVLGFGIGLVTTYVPIDDNGAWEGITGEDFEGLPVVGVQATKGLPLNIDIGLFYTSVPSTNVDVFGGEIRYAILPGSVALPALALRASYVSVSGIDDFDVESKGLDLSLSKGFGFVTPYVGVGKVWGEVDPASTTAEAALDRAEVEETKLFAGLRLSLGLLEFTPQVDKIGDVTSYTARLGFSFSL